MAAGAQETVMTHPPMHLTTAVHAQARQEQLQQAACARRLRRDARSRGRAARSGGVRLRTARALRHLADRVEPPRRSGRHRRSLTV
jgi:hypothetical protein